MKRVVITAVCVLIGISAVAAIQHFFPSPKIAYVDTGKLMVAFTEASRAQKSLEEQGAKWKHQYKTLQDSVQAAMDSMLMTANRISFAKTILDDNNWALAIWAIAFTACSVFSGYSLLTELKTTNSDSGQ